MTQFGMGKGAPMTPAAWFGVAQQYLQAGQWAQAETACRQLLALAPRHADGLQLLALACSQQGRHEQALGYFQQSAQAVPHFGPYQHNLASAYQDLGDRERAIAAYRVALGLQPVLPETRKNLGVLLREQGLFDEAIRCFQAALAHDPGSLDSQLNLAGCYRDQGREDEAMLAYQAVLAQRPDFVAASNVAMLHAERGDYAQALAAFEQALTVQDAPGVRFKAALLMPVIPASVAEIAAARVRCAARLAALVQAPVTLADPINEVGMTPFLLAYQGENDRDLMQTLAQACLRACPALDFTAEHCRQPRPLPAGKIRIGFVSRYFSLHSVGRMMQGIIEHLSRDQFELHLFLFEEPTDELGRYLAGRVDQAHLLPKPFTLEQGQHYIAKQQLDILFYPDIGMDPLTYFLAFARLAPLQCVTWGHLDTTGIPNIDVYLSHADAEPDDGDAHYSEQLLRLRDAALYPGLPAPLPCAPRTRAELGLPEAAHLYICPQSHFKLHPEFDAVLAEILRRDPLGVLILPEGKPHQRAHLLHRLGQHLAPERIHWMPKLTLEVFRQWIAAADVMLDPLHYGGGVSSLDAFPTGTPIVTLPGAYMRGRLTMACYRRMGIDTCVVADVDAYVDLALRLANDPAFNQSVRAHILAQQHRLFEDVDGVLQLGEQLRAALLAQVTRAQAQ